MTVLELLGVALAGLAAGTINTVVGSGTLVTFPALLAVGLPPVVANTSNCLGLVPGSVVGAWGYRHELRGQRARALRFGAASLVGGVVGGVLLLALPEDAFSAVVPVLIVVACVLVVLQPRLARRAARRGGARPHGGPLLLLGVAGTGVYGGYFGAAQGVILMGLLGATLAEDLQRLNALKNVLAGLVNAVAALLFIVAGEVDYRAAAAVAVGAALGGLVGARIGRRLSPAALRGLVVLVGLLAVAQLVVA
ncbi:sulfite exporter TauE/SafE family protein [Vallicoccus soli]|uniref:Probable membrane transporter protein n=1 Tax=Vallicoccus soli TaxID=2339232 RepID=A0A3A3YVA1_9ACTN|nr:sulfite exporter TauE/SafE family protein [Vallicoccus soli]RJK93794.1 sulfite exporter TauE/SafE family protein [Vallicoccus soli]